MEMSPKRKATLEKQISRAGGVRQYVDLLRRSYRSDCRSGLLRSEGTSRRQCEKMLTELDKMEARLTTEFPHLVTI